MDAICRRVADGTLDPPRLDHIVYVAQSAFEFARYARGGPYRLAITFLVRDHLGDPIDIAAWSPPQPVALWLGRGLMIGGENLFRPRMREGLMIHSSPLEFLRARGFGVVVLNFESARDLLFRARPLEVESPSHGRELRAHMEVTPPTILVSPKWRAGA
jgi:hypothetical protein